MLKQLHPCWVSKVIGMPLLQMNWQIFVSMAMLVKFGFRTATNSVATSLNYMYISNNCQWILSVLNKAISKTVTSLDSYEFSDAATAVYSWWQFQLCDVFIEAVKPYFASDAQAFACERSSAQDTLSVCLE
ncbi:hypothetical protein CsSME_00021841 [Camellia sinensis var. sinensis]